MIGYVLPGSLIAGTGFIFFFVLLVMHGGMSKSKQLQVVSALLGGKKGKSAKKQTLAAFALMGMGMLGSFCGVAMADADRADACAATCTRRGYRTSTIDQSTERDPENPNRASFVACICSGNGMEPVELSADALVD
jgi:hypothetical protein